jgi:hypothetical protein
MKNSIKIDITPVIFNMFDDAQVRGGNKFSIIDTIFCLSIDSSDMRRLIYIIGANINFANIILKS